MRVAFKGTRQKKRKREVKGTLKTTSYNKMLSKIVWVFKNIYLDIFVFLKDAFEMENISSNSMLNPFLFV